MVTTWFIGVHGLSNGCSTIAYLREGNVTSIEEAQRRAADQEDPLQRVLEVQAAARLRAMADGRDRTFPLGIAKMLLGGLLVIASGMALSGRRGARNLAFQALAANFALGLIDYGMTREVRGMWIAAVVQAKATMPSLLPEHEILMNARWLWWTERARFALVDVGILGMAALALSSHRTRAYFDAVAATYPPDPPDGSR
jgi:hypothetical protein